MEKTKPQQNPTKFVRELKVNNENQTLSPKHNLKNILPTIRCFCGAKILIIRDSKAMEVAIGNHLDKHRRAEKDPKKAAVVWALAEQFFIEQLFDYASNMEEEWQLV